MNFMKGFVFLWLFVFFVFGLLFSLNYFEKSFTGYIPFTGVLKEDATRAVSFPDLEIGLGLREEKVLRLRDLEFFIDFLYDSNLRNDVDLEYLVLDKEGNLLYSEKDSILIKESFRYEKSFDTLEAQKIEFSPGNYTFILKVDYLGKTKSFNGLFEIVDIDESFYSLKQLFDIKMEVDDLIFDTLEDFSARVVFESFGSEPTPVNLTFLIFDSNGKQVYSKKDLIVVETEEVVIENFVDLEIDPGKYILVLRTLYNVNVEDYFEQSFEYVRKAQILPFVLGGIIVLSALFFVFRDKFLKNSSRK